MKVLNKLPYFNNVPTEAQIEQIKISIELDRFLARFYSKNSDSIFSHIKLYKGKPICTNKTEFGFWEFHERNFHEFPMEISTKSDCGGNGEMPVYSYTGILSDDVMFVLDDILHIISRGTSIRFGIN